MHWCIETSVEPSMFFLFTAGLEMPKTAKPVSVLFPVGWTTVMQSNETTRSCVKRYGRLDAFEGLGRCQGTTTVMWMFVLRNCDLKRA